MNSEDIKQKLKAHYGWHLLQGILFVVFGILAIALPRLTALSLELLLGALLLISGLLALLTNIKSRVHWWSYAPAILTLLIGLVMLSRPLVGLVALSLFICLFLLVKGISEIILGYKYRTVKNWAWFLISGVIALILAFVAGLGFPDVGIIFLGLIIGINMLLYGIAILAVAWGVNQ